VPRIEWAALHQAMADQGPHGWCSCGVSMPQNVRIRRSPNFTGAPTSVLRLHVLDTVHLKGKVDEQSDRVRQSLDSAFLVAILNLVAGLAGNAELPREFRQGRPNNGISGRKLEAQTNFFSNFFAERHLPGFIIEVLPGMALSELVEPWGRRRENFAR
jgi:hypothetical protein